MKRIAGPLIIVALALAACGGSSPAASPSGAANAPASEAESMAESMAASATEAAASHEPVNLDSAATGVSNLTAYQMVLSVVSGSQRQTLTILATKMPVEATQYVMSGDSTLEVISIVGEGAWTKQGDTWAIAPGGGGLLMSLFDAMAPDTLIAAYSLGTYGDSLDVVGTEDHNGVRALHYHLDASEAAALQADGFPADGTFDAWVATDGGYLLGMAFEATNPDTGEHANVEIEVTRVNDPSIVIEAPI